MALAVSFSLGPLTEAVFRCHRKVDMALLLDGSASITRKQFAKSKKFVADLVKHFEFSNNKTNVAALTFSRYTRVGRHLNDDSSKEAVLKAIDGLTYEGSITRLDSALKLLSTEIFRRSPGARFHDKGVKKVVVVVTDGLSSRGIEITRWLTKPLKNNGVKFFSVGIANRVNRDELNEVTSQPIETHQLIRDISKSSFTKWQVDTFAREICNQK
ncbi:cartilage matrix protein-like [Montipora capricornis]|uniref:cartilage matrix protein-like n=1 Tax=Montipora capricornis TaxID=246305 RepID=UPI0035F1BEED